MKHPITATNTALSTPPSGRRFCKLLTPGTNTFGLTKVNKLAQRIENQCYFVHVFAGIKARNRHFVNRRTTKRQQIFWFMNQGHTVWQRSSNVVHSRYHPVSLKLKRRVSFSLLRFFWTSKRNEGQLSSDHMLKPGMWNTRSPKAFYFRINQSFHKKL